MVPHPSNFLPKLCRFSAQMNDMICDLLKLDASKLPATLPHDRNEQFYNAAGDSAIKPATKRRILNEFLNGLPLTPANLAFRLYQRCRQQAGLPDDVFPVVPTKNSGVFTSQRQPVKKAPDPGANTTVFRKA